MLKENFPNQIPNNFLVVSLDDFEMYCHYKTESYSLKLVSANSYYYERRMIETDEIIDADICDIDHLRNSSSIPGVVQWMARGYKGLPTDGLTDELKTSLAYG